MKNIDPIPDLIKQVDQERIRKDLFYLAKDPLPYRKVNYTLPGHAKSTLDEADDYIIQNLEKAGYKTEKEACQVQAFRRDESKPIRSQFATPEPEDPWYTAYNIYAKKQGTTKPDEIIIFISHKDSQSWIDSPGAYDNTVGTVANLEIARILKNYPSQRSLWFIFCNEEHRPWTSVTAANNARDRGDNIIAVFNLDGLGGKSQEDTDAGKKTSFTLYTAPEGERLADLMAEINEKYNIGLIQQKYQRSSPGDDDGSYIKAGYMAAIANIGSYPYADPNYHAPGDVPELVDIQNLVMSTKASLAAAVTADLGS
jgi:hypothetical protein